MSLLFFLYGLINNMSLSYMGNTNKQFEEYILNNFLGDIVIFLLKIFIVYMTAGLVLGLTAQLLILAFLRIINKSISLKTGFILNLIITGIIFILSFARDIIMYPQVYMNNFYNKNNINKFIVDTLTAGVNPDIISAILVIIAANISAVFIIYLYRVNKKILKIMIGFILAVIIAGFAAGHPGITARPGTGKPNILILASDALRPDHFSGYGYKRKTTPNIDSLIEDGTSFRNAFIEVPRTFPSWVSILTGQFSSTHGIRHMFPTSRDLNRDFKSIAKILKKEGFGTSVIADYAGDIFSRIELGFDEVDAPYFNFNYVLQQTILEAHTFLLPLLTGRLGLTVFPVLKDWAYFCPAESVRERVIKSIDKSKGPFFIATFFSSTHFPYAAPYPYYKLYTDKNYSGTFKYYKQRMVSPDSKEDVNISESDINQVNALYDGCLRAFDDAVGEILTHLSKSGMLENTIIILLSDHGENLYETGLGMGHGEHFRGLYSIRIPLIFRIPGAVHSRKEIKDIVRHVDIAPTILSLLKIPVPEYMEGKSLLPLIHGGGIEKFNAFGETGIWFDNTVRDDLFFQKLRIMYPDITGIAETDFNFDRQVVLKDSYRDLINFSKHRYIFDGRYKLIYIPLKDRVLYELYDTAADPEEKNNIADIDSKNLSRLKQLLFAWIQRNRDAVVRKDYIFPLMRY
ncbi:MAG: sulfatase-like hydrolase/transferase [Spirochaetes bacterium]|nr:sulfatase-like hydrolase/transferase [Spirochaetota bacterium]